MSTNEQTTPWTGLTHAIIVCGHAVYCGGPNLTAAEEPWNDRHWVLQSFQTGEGKNYIDHIKAGVFAASEDSESLLIFSGGQTRMPYIQSEAQGYHDIANIFDFWGNSKVSQRVTTEEFARDSFDNVLFSICRFRECVGTLPLYLTVIGWSFKEERIRLHARGIQWPMHRFNYIGVGSPKDLHDAQRAEIRTTICFLEDITGYGSKGGPLGKKKDLRNPYRRQHGYDTSCPELRHLLAWRGTVPIDPAKTPWGIDTIKS